MRSPRDLDRAVEARWPGLFGYANPRTRLRLALAYQVVAAALVILGPPWSYGAGGMIGATIALLIGYLAKVDKYEDKTR
jgi:hypothetical protein